MYIQGQPLLRVSYVLLGSSKGAIEKVLQKIKPSFNTFVCDVLLFP